MSGTQTVDVGGIDYHELAGKSIEQLEALGTGAPADDKPKGDEGDTGAGTSQDGKPGDGDTQQGKDKQDVVEGASSGATDANAAPAKPDGEGNDAEKNLAAMRRRMQRQQQELEAAEQRNRELAEKLAATEGKQTVTDLAAIDADIKSYRDKAEQLRDDAPGIAADYIAAAEKLEAMRNTLQVSLDEKQSIEERRKQETEAERRDREQDAIEQNPVLAHWQKNDVTSWNLLVNQYENVKDLPGFKDKPIGEVLARCAEAVKSLNPEHTLPTQSTPPAGDKTPKDGSTKPATDTKPEEGKAAPIQSLSDLPGGMPAAENEAAALTEMSPHALGNKFLRDPSKINEFLSALS